MIQSLLTPHFANIVVSEKSPCRNKEEVADIILSYSGIVYDLVRNQLQYAVRNQNHPFRNRPLKITYMSTPQQRTFIAKTIEVWKLLGNSYTQQCNVDLEQQLLNPTANLENLKHLRQTIVRLDDHNMICAWLLRWTEVSTLKIATVVDQAEVIQAISVFLRDNQHPTACKIEYLLSAPHNIVKKESETKLRVEGAAAALIENAFLHSLAYQSIDSREVSQEDVFSSAVTLKSYGVAKEFYKHIHFKPYDTNKIVFGFSVSAGPDMILTGANLQKFLEKYGGRASYPSL